MKSGIRLLVMAGILLGLTTGAEAVTRGGKMVYARYADSLFLDPVLNDANVDIWILTNLYDTLLQPTADGKGVNPGLASAYQVSDLHPHPAPGDEILRRLANHRRGCE